MTKSEIKRLCNVKMTIIPMVIGTLGTRSKLLPKGLNDIRTEIHIDIGVVIYMQKMHPFILQES